MVAQAQQQVDEEVGGESSPLQPLLAHLAELQEYLSHYLAAKSDLVKHQVRKILLLAVAGLLGGIALTALVVKSVLLVLEGISLGLSAWTGWAWLGPLATGAAVLALLIVGYVIAIAGWKRSSRRRSIEHYEERQRRQRAAFGHDIASKCRASQQDGPYPCG